jgi:hypothetical protein
MAPNPNALKHQAKLDSFPNTEIAFSGGGAICTNNANPNPFTKIHHTFPEKRQREKQV